MTLKDELMELAGRVEAATGKDRTLEQDIHDAVFGRDYLENAFQQDGSRILPFTASLDAAMQLVPEGWAAGFEENARCDEPGKSYAWTWPLESDYDPDWQLGQEGQQSNPDALKGYAATPALALTAAALRARASIKGSSHVRG